MVKRRTPIGTQPPVAAVEPAQEVSGVILVPAPEKPEKAAAAETIIVDIDDSWLDRLDLAD